VPVPPKRRTGVIIAVAAGVVAVIVLAGLGVVVLPRVLGTNSDHAQATGPTTQTADTPSAARSPSPSPTETHFAGNLRDLLVPVPSGATTADYFGVGDKVLTLSQYAAIYKDKQLMMEELDALAFQRATIRTWKAADSSQVAVTLIQFGDDTKANGFAASIQGAYASDSMKTDDGYLTGIDLSRYFVFDKPDSYGFRAIDVVYSKNDIMVIVQMNRRTLPRLDSVLRLAQDQFARLP
jgi:hypothetical protein